MAVYKEEKTGTWRVNYRYTDWTGEKKQTQKQDYITRRLLCKDVVVQGNPRVYKALRDQLAAVLDELRRIEAGEGVNDELIDTINLIANIMDGMKEDDAYGN